MNATLGNGLILKLVHEEALNQYLWILFKEGELANPIIIFSDYQINNLAAVVQAEQQRRATTGTSAGGG